MMNALPPRSIDPLVPDTRATDTGALPPDHPPVAFGKIGVLVINLGTPDAPETGPVRRYLAQFLSDRRVVELPPIIWQPLLRGFILTTRPKRSAANYARIWDHDGSESPLRRITREQAAALQAALGDGVIVDWAMRYGTPAVSERLAALKAAGCERILIAPLYPQYSSATTGTVNDQVFDTLKSWRWQPALRTLPPYHDDPAYIEALAASVTAQLGALDFVPELLLASFHGMPRRTLDRGDPYHCQCQKTARLLAMRLRAAHDLPLRAERDLPLRVSFQSRLGRAEWLRPYTDEVLAALPGEGVRKLAIMAPGFAADNLETLEELALQGRETFLAAGGSDFVYLPCLNVSTEGTSLLHNIVRRELAGWLPLT